MRTILTILLVFLLAGCRAQCDTSKVDTIPQRFVVSDPAPYYNYYNANGVPAWMNKNHLDSALIPRGGYYTIFYKPDRYVDGFGLWRAKGNCDMYIVRRVDKKYKDIPGIINPAVIIREQ